MRGTTPLKWSLRPRLFLPAQSSRDRARHDRLDPGVLDGVRRHLEFLGAALGMDGAGRRQALHRIHPGPRQRLGGGCEHDLVDPVLAGREQHLVRQRFDALDEDGAENLDARCRPELLGPVNSICMPQGTSRSRTRSPAGPLDSMRME